MGLLSIVNELVVDEVEKSVEFYQKIFSFSVELTDGNPISWAQLKKDNMEIMLEEYKTVKEEIKGFPKKTRTSNLLKFEYDNLDELKAVYSKCRENSYEIFIEYTKTEYDKIEFGVLDLDKNMIIVSCPATYKEVKK